MRTDSSWKQRLQEDGRRVIILDDDPTGTQTVSNVEVILRPSPAAYQRFFQSSEQAVYILTNSRALSREQAVSLLSHIRADVEVATAKSGQKVAFLLRGDSTLRGHVFAEVDTLASSFEDWVCLFVPAFPEGGRITVDGVHYLLVDGERIPVARTEFARDTTFGYQSEHIVAWAAEVGGGRRALSLPLAQLRAQGAALITRTLLEAPCGTTVIPDAETATDLETIALGLLDAEAQGRTVIVRSASTFAALRSGLHGEIISSVGTIDGPILVVCGSHTEASSRQLEQLIEQTSVAPVVIPTNWLLQEGPDAVVPRLARQLSLALKEQKFAILATERIRLPEHGDLETGARVMDALTAMVTHVADECSALIVKGGISSAQVALEGLSASWAHVRGQLEPGVSLWDLTLADGRVLPYTVIPGNVGHDMTIVNIARQFQITPLRAPGP